jgi:hypothetical protein
MFMNAFGNNSHLKARIEELGYEPSRFRLQFLIHEWYAKFFRLKPDMEEIYREFLKKRTWATNLCACSFEPGSRLLQMIA